MSIELGDAAGMVGGAAGVAAFIVAWRGNAHAKRANAEADKANKIANKANDKSDESNTIAREANSIAEGANAFAREANDLAHHQDRRETESHDVRWEGDWIAPGQYALVTSGAHTAHDVVARVSVDDKSVRLERAVVGPGEQIIFEFPEAGREYQEELREYRRGTQQPQRSFPPEPIFLPMQFHSHYIEEWVQWKTVLGAVKEHESGGGMRTLGEFD